MELSAKGFGNTLLTQLEPVLTPMLNGLSTWLSDPANQQALAGGIVDIAKSLGEALRDIPWKEVGAGIKEVSQDISGLIKELNGTTPDGHGLAHMIEGYLALKAVKTVAGGSVLGAAGAGSGVLGWLGSLLGAPLGAGVALGVGGGVGAGLMTQHAWDQEGIMYDPNTGVAVPNTFGTTPAPSTAMPESQQGLTGVASGLWGWFRRQFSGGGSSFNPAVPPLTGREAATVPQGEQATLARQAFDFYVSKGLSREAAAGVVAGLIRENGMKTGDAGDGGLAWGIGSWHPDRQAAFKRIFGHDIQHSNFAEQLQFKLMELQGSGGDPQSAEGYRRMMQTGTTAGQAGELDSLFGERPADQQGEAARRGALAQKLYELYGPAPTGAHPAVPPPPSQTPASGSAQLSIRLNGFPDSTQVASVTSGDLWDGPPKVERSLSGMAMA